MDLGTRKALLLFLILLVTWQVLYPLHPLGVNSLMAYSIVLAVLTCFLLLDRQNLAILGLRKTSNWKTYAAIGVVFGTILAIYFPTLGSVLDSNAPQSVTQPLIFDVQLGVLSIPYVAALAFVIGLVGEVSFRGYILRNLMSSFSHQKALLLSATLFGLYQISIFNIYYSPLPPSRTFTFWSSFILYAFVTSVFLGQFYMNTEKTIIGPIAYNSSNIFIQSFVPYVLAFSSAAGHVLSIIPVLVFIPLLAFLKRTGWLESLNHGSKGAESGPETAPHFSPGVNERLHCVPTTYLFQTQDHAWRGNCCKQHP